MAVQHPGWQGPSNGHAFQLDSLVFTPLFGQAIPDMEIQLFQLHPDHGRVHQGVRVAAGEAEAVVMICDDQPSMVIHRFIPLKGWDI